MTVYSNPRVCEEHAGHSRESREGTRIIPTNGQGTHPYYRKLQRVLERAGDLYTVNDILIALDRNEMQSFVQGESVAITRIAQYPRAKVLEVFAVVGALDDLRILHDRILIFAAEVGAGVIQAYGRMGWMPDAQRRGWKIKAKNYVYQRDM